MRIAVMGAGGIGGYVGGRLAEAGAEVTFIARGAHLEALQTNGLTIQSPEGDPPPPKGPCDG
jgi:2-dehydropantoate 2-reductase